MENGIGKLRIDMTIKVLLLFGGIIAMMVLAYILSVGAVAGYLLARGIESGSLKLALGIWMKAYQSTLLMAVSALAATMSGIWMGILYRRSAWRTESFSYAKELGGMTIPWLVILGAAGCVVSTVGMSVFSQIWSKSFENYQEIMSHLSDTTSMLTLVYVLVIGPVSEEFIFRGAILDRLNLAYPFWAANLFQAFLFGLYHGNFWQGLYAFALGCLLGLVRMTVGSIAANIILHMTYNATSYLLQIVFAKDGAAQRIGLIVLTVLSLAALAAGVLLFWRKWKERRRNWLGQNEKNVQ